MNDLEDEFHFTLVCPAYSELRKMYIQKYFYAKPSMLKFMKLLDSTKTNVLTNLALFITKAFSLRQNSLNANQDVTV